MISVIVPVYNVEKYLRKCLDSILNQTYQNFEVILVNDGSTDDSGKICNEYALRNPVIKAFHKKNGGLSEARNYGVVYAKGEYVTFIDSDDYIDEHYLERMKKALNLSNADIVIVGQIDETEDGNILGIKGDSKEEIKILSPMQTLEKMCYEREIGTSAWGKLYRIEYIRKNPFPKGKLYEDLATVYKIIGDSGKIVLLSSTFYHYIQRPGSIRNSTWNENVMDIMDASLQLLNYVRCNFPDIEVAAVYRYFFSANEVFTRAFEEKKYLKIVASIRNDLLEMWPFIRKNISVTNRQKIRYYLMAYHPVCYRVIWKVAKRGVY